MKLNWLIIGGSVLAIGTGTLVMIAMRSPSKKLLRAARKYLGIEETGQNGGFSDPKYEAAMRAVGWSQGLEWCCFSVKKLLVEIARGKALDFWKKNVNGSTQLTWKNLQTPSKYHEISQKPKEGALIFYQQTADPGKGHVEIVSKVNRDGSYEVISGNSGIPNTNKQGVAQKTRSRTGIPGFRILGYVIIKKTK